MSSEENAPDQAENADVVHDWSAFYDDSGEIYYYNSVTNESSWDPPDKFNPPPPKEEDTADVADGETNQEIDEPPVDTSNSVEDSQEDSQVSEPVKSGAWAAYQDDSGQTYYYNEETGATQWEAPEGFGEKEEEAPGVSPPREGTPPPSSPVAEGIPPDEPVEPEQQEPEPEPEPEPEIDPAQKRLEDAEKALNEPDAIMEPACLDNVGELLSSLGGQGGQKAMQALIKSFHGHTAVCGLLGLWLSDLKATTNTEKEEPVQPSDSVRDTVQEVVNKIAKERFTKTGGDNIFKLKKSEAVFLEEMMDSERWRKLLIDLSAANRDSTLLNYCLSSISKRGHHREIAKRINQSDHFAVYNAMLASEFGVVGCIASGSEVDTDSSMSLHELVDDLRRTCTSTTYTYLYAIEVLRYLVSTAREHLADSDGGFKLRQAIRKWERLREELESAMVDPTTSAATAGASTVFRKRRLDVALTVSELHQRQRRRMSPAIANDGADNERDAHRDMLETALAKLLRRSANNLPLDDANLDMLLPDEGDDGSEVGRLMIAYPLSVRILLGHLFKPRSGRVTSMMTRTKCARLLALAVLAAERSSGEETGVEQHSDEEARSEAEERLKGMFLTGSQMCEMVENMVSFTVTSDINKSEPNPSAGIRLSILALKCAPIAQGVVLWATELVRAPDFVSSASYPTLSSSILSLVRIVALRHPFTRPIVLEVSLMFLKHTNSEVSYQRMTELKEQCLRVLLFLLVNGEVAAVLGSLTSRLKQQGSSEIDASLVRYFVGNLLDVIGPPYSAVTARSLGAFLLAPRCLEALGSAYFQEEKKAKVRKLVKDLNIKDKRLSL